MNSWQQFTTILRTSHFGIPFITAPYCDALSYNGGPVEIFHTGVYFAGTIGTEIRAPAAGTVVFSDTLTLRGSSVIVDHGLGVMTGYYHLSKILVPVGEAVTIGQIIGEGGSSGLSSGPHLHWDLRILNVPVDPMPWLDVDLLNNLSSRADSESDQSVP
jgi:murein DD-endopeptidase MepM/ murein hydrolase activator NlpD